MTFHESDSLIQPENFAVTDADNFHSTRPELIDGVDEDTQEQLGMIYPPSRIWIETRKSLLLQPSVPVLTIANGLPVSGKTTYLRQGLDWMFSDEVTDQALREIYDENGTLLPDPHTTSIVEFELPWGDTFYGIDSNDRVSDDYEDPKVYQKKLREIAHAVENLSRGLQASISTAARMHADGEQRPIIIQADMNTLTGMDMNILKYGRSSRPPQDIGMRRGDELYYDIIKHRGAFDNTNLTYQDFHIGMYRSKDVFNIGLTQRQVIENEEDIRSRVRALRANGTHINFDDQRELAAFLDHEQSARPNELFQLERDAYQPMSLCYDMNLLAQNVGDSFETFMDDSKRLYKARFENAHAQYLLLYMNRYMDIPQERLTLAANRTVQKEIHLDERNVTVDRIRPLRDWADAA